METVYLIDRVQKKLPISKGAVQHLRSLKVIEGKSPSFYISPMVAGVLDKKAQYIKNKGFDDSHYCDLIIAYLKKFKRASKKDIRGLLFDKLPDVLDAKQKEHKIKNLLYGMKQQGIIEKEVAGQKSSDWVLAH